MKTNYSHQIFETIQGSCKELEANIYNGILAEFAEVKEKYHRILDDYKKSSAWKEKLAKFEQDLGNKLKYDIINAEAAAIRLVRFTNNEPARIAQYDLYTNYVDPVGKLKGSEFDKAARAFSRTIKGMIVNRQYHLQSDEKYSGLAHKCAKETVEDHKMKLKNAINKKLNGLDITEVCRLYVHVKAGNIEGAWVLTLADGRKVNFSTEIITAGGYNIQCYHYRYLAKMKYQK